MTASRPRSRNLSRANARSGPGAGVSAAMRIPPRRTPGGGLYVNEKEYCRARTASRYLWGEENYPTGYSRFKQRRYPSAVFLATPRRSEDEVTGNGRPSAKCERTVTDAQRS